MKALVGALNQEKALVGRENIIIIIIILLASGAFPVITELRMGLRFKL